MPLCASNDMAGPVPGMLALAMSWDLQLLALVFRLCFEPGSRSFARHSLRTFRALDVA